jgi:hypothetical protein
MIHLFNGQYWYFPAINELDSPQDTGSSPLIIVGPTVDSPSLSRRTAKETKAEQPTENI